MNWGKKSVYGRFDTRQCCQMELILWIISGAIYWMFCAKYFLLNPFFEFYRNRRCIYCIDMLYWSHWDFNPHETSIWSGILKCLKSILVKAGSIGCICICHSTLQLICWFTLNLDETLGSNYDKDENWEGP